MPLKEFCDVPFPEYEFSAGKYVVFSELISGGGSTFRLLIKDLSKNTDEEKFDYYLRGFKIFKDQNIIIYETFGEFEVHIWDLLKDKDEIIDISTLHYNNSLTDIAHSIRLENNTIVFEYEGKTVKYVISKE